MDGRPSTAFEESRCVFTADRISDVSFIPFTLNQKEGAVSVAMMAKTLPFLRPGRTCTHLLVHALAHLELVHLRGNLLDARHEKFEAWPVRRLARFDNERGTLLLEVFAPQNARPLQRFGLINVVFVRHGAARDSHGVEVVCFFYLSFLRFLNTKQKRGRE